MFCKNCGSPLNNNEVFCGKCGTRVSSAENSVAEEVNTQPVQENVSTPEEAFVVEAETVKASEETVVVEQTVSPAVSEEPKAAELQMPVNQPLSPEEAAPEKPVKKGKKGAKSVWKKIGISVAGVIVALGVAIGIMFAVNPAYAMNFLAKTFLSPEQYMGYVIKSNAEDLAETLSSGIALSKQYTADDMSADGVFEVTLGDGLDELLNDAGVYDTASFDWINSAAITYSAAANKSAGSADMTLKLNNVDLGTVNYAIDVDNQTVYYSLPEYNPTALAIDMDPYGYTSADYSEIAAAAEKLIDILPDEKATKKMLENYAVCIVKAIDDVEKSSEKITADGVSQKVTKLSLDIDGELILKASENVLNEAKEDENIKKMIEETEDVTGFTFEDFQDNIDELLDDLEDADPDDFDAKVSLDLYVNNKGKIVGCGLSASGTKFTLYTTQDGKKFGTLAEIKASGTKLALEGSCTEDNNKRSGEYFVKYDSSSIVNIKIENIDMPKLNEGIFNGQFSISLTDKANSLLRYVDNGNILTKLSLTVQSNSESATKLDSRITVNYENKPCVELYATENISSGKQVSLPSNYITFDIYDSDEAFATWAAGFDLSTLTEKLRSAGLPEMLAGGMEGALTGSETATATDNATTNAISVTPYSYR
ncbi:MAG: zinc-ribbon domain-containing protein [Clostridia bacterium]|nr:zinc-ribbon domain-containing protein [Clostridia bacterium]